MKYREESGTTPVPRWEGCPTAGHTPALQNKQDPKSVELKQVAETSGANRKHQPRIGTKTENGDFFASGRERGA